VTGTSEATACDPALPKDYGLKLHSIPVQTLRWLAWRLSANFKLPCSRQSIESLHPYLVLTIGRHKPASACSALTAQDPTSTS
jgi:hypothetical protein